MQPVPSRISLIAAIAENRVIGRGGKLPWHLPADLGHFKRLTMGKPMVMGRRTWQSLPGRLPGRRHIVVSRNHDFRADGCELAGDLHQALQLAGAVSEVMVIGGAELYSQMLPLASRMYLTLIHASFEGDSFFPDIDCAEWQEMERERHTADEKNSCDFTFLDLERRR